MNRWGKCGSELEGMDTKGATESGGATDSPNAGRLWPVRVQSELKMKVRSVVYRCGGWKPSTYEWDWVEKPSVKSPQSWGLESSLDYFVLVFQEFSGEIWRKKIKTIPERAHHSTSAQKRMTVTPSIHIQIMLSTAKRTSNTKGREGAALAQVTARPQAGLSTPTRTSCQNLKHAPTDTRVTAKCSKKTIPRTSHCPSSTGRKESKDEVTELREVEQPGIPKFRGYCQVCADQRQARGSLRAKPCEALSGNIPGLHRNMCPSLSDMRPLLNRSCPAFQSCNRA